MLFDASPTRVAVGAPVPVMGYGGLAARLGAFASTFASSASTAALPCSPSFSTRASTGVALAILGAGGPVRSLAGTPSAAARLCRGSRPGPVVAFTPTVGGCPAALVGVTAGGLGASHSDVAQMLATRVVLHGRPWSTVFPTGVTRLCGCTGRTPLIYGEVSAPSTAAYGVVSSDLSATAITP